MNSIIKFFVDNKNIFSSIFAFLVFIYIPLQNYLTSQPFDWKTFIFFVFGSIVSFTVGKYPTGLVKPDEVSRKDMKVIEKQGYASTEDLTTPKDLTTDNYDHSSK